MSDNSTKRLIELYLQEASAPMFLSGFFQTPSRNIHTSEMVEIDIIREDPDVAIVVQDLKAGGRENEATKYVNKGFIPPIFDEEGTITAYDLIKRQPGVDPFQDPNFGMNATDQAFKIIRRLENKIRRAIELMASQVLQEGKLTLSDSNGVALYTLDFVPKTTHMKTVTTTWAVDGLTGAPLADLDALAVIVRRDGQGLPNKLLFGSSAFQRFTANTDVRAKIFTNFNSQQIAQLTPQSRGQGATFQGFVWIGNYRFEMWTYDGYYKHPQTGTLTPFIDDDNVIMLSDVTRLDLTYGGIPSIVSPESRVLPFLPPRISSSDAGLDLNVFAWITPDGKHLKVSGGTRPLTIPTAIDRFARLNVTA